MRKTGTQSFPESGLIDVEMEFKPRSPQGLQGAQPASLRELRHFCKLFPNGAPQLTLLKMQPILAGGNRLVLHTFPVKCQQNDCESRVPQSTVNVAN